MTTENQNSAGTTSALAQKTGIKPLAKIIAGVCVAIVALVAFCSGFGDPTSVAAVKNSVWEYDKAITFEEAVAHFCEKTAVDKDFRESDLVEKSLRKDGLSFISKFIKGKKRDYSAPEWSDSGATSTGVHVVTLKIPFLETGYAYISGLRYSFMDDVSGFFRWKNEEAFKKAYPSADISYKYKDGELAVIEYKCPFSYRIEFVVSSDGEVEVRKGSVSDIYKCIAR